MSCESMEVAELSCLVINYLYIETHMQLWASSHADLFLRYCKVHSLPHTVESLQQYLKDVGTLTLKVSSDIPPPQGGLRTWLRVPEGSCITLRKPMDYMNLLVTFVKD